MRRDSIFYKLFQRSPTLLFDLLPDPPENTDGYRFDSVAVKEPRFEIDGVILPPEGKPGAVFFVEVQFQKDEQLYERVFAESALYFYRNRKRFTDWQAVVIYPSRSTEQSDLYPHRRLLACGQLYRIYLDELGDIQQLSPWIALMVLTTVDEANAPREAKALLKRSNQTDSSDESRAIIDMVITIISYRFGQINRQEVEKMLDISFEETRVYREIMAEGRAEGKAEGRAEGKAEGRAEGRAEGKTEGEAKIILRLLEKRFGVLPDTIQTEISRLPLAALEDLSELLLDFKRLSEVQAWLAERKIS